MTQLRRFDAELPDENEPKKSNEKILYVEDEDANWEVAELALRDRYTLVRARDAREAFKMLSSTSFKLILMDIQLSGSDLSGIEITQVLRGRFPREAPVYTKSVSSQTTPIIFVTAYSARYSRTMLIAEGGDEMMIKPVNFTSLSLAMTRLLTRSTREKLEKP